MFKHRARSAGPDKLVATDKRAQILRGAAKVFANDGYEGTSMSNIAREAGVSKGTLYNHFVSKAALFSAWVGEVCDRRLAVAMHPLGDGIDNAPRTLRLVARNMIRLLFSPDAVTIDKLLSSEGQRFPELAEAFLENGPSKAVKMLAGWLAQASEADILAVDDCEFAAEQFFVLCQTRFHLRRRLFLITELDDAEADRVVDAAVAMFVARYGKRIEERHEADVNA